MSTPSNPSDEPRSTASIGPTATADWTFDGSRVGLIRTPRRPRPLRFAAEPHPLEIDVAASALVVVDMQNDFCHPDGWFGRKGVDLAPVRQPIEVIAALLEPWRAAGGSVVRLNWGVRADALELPPLVHFAGKRDAAGGRSGSGYADPVEGGRGPAVVAGSWGAETIDELAPDARDITVWKHRLSGFHDNELDSVLRHLGVTTLLFCGVNTDRCVFSTLQDAGFRGYDPILLTDACGTSSPPFVIDAIHFLVHQLHGFTATAAALGDALATFPGATTP